MRHIAASVIDLKRSKEESSTQQLQQIKKIRHKSQPTFKKKSNEDQYKTNKSVLETIEDAQAAVVAKVKTSLEEGTKILNERQKMIVLADKSQYGWKTALEYKHHDLPSDNDDEKKIYHAEARAAKSAKRFTGGSRGLRRPSTTHKRSLANFAKTFVRRDKIRHVYKEYKAISATSDVPSTSQYLFGDDLAKQLRDAREASKISNHVTYNGQLKGKQKTSKSYRYNVENYQHHHKSVFFWSWEVKVPLYPKKGTSRKAEQVTSALTLQLQEKKDKKELTQCPANSKRKDVGAGYSSFVSNLKAFQELHIDPTPYINVSLLDQDSLVQPVHCFFCEKSDDATNLHAASMLEVDQKMTTTDLDELAFAEVIAYIDEFLECQALAVLKLSELAAFYQLKQQELGVHSVKVNATRLKDRILDAFPDLSAHTEGRQVLFALKQDIGGVLRAANSRKDTEVYHLAKTASIVRKDLLKVKNKFNGTFSENCQSDSIPASLKTLLHMIMKGPTSENSDSQSCVSIAQLIIFNSIGRARDRETNSIRHTRFRECPLPIYTASFCRTRFVVICYERTSSLTRVNRQRQQMFSKKSKTIDSIPPTKAALVQHMRRAIYQGVCVWRQTLVPQPVLPCPSAWGWKREGTWVPYWTTLLQANEICQELIRCGYSESEKSSDNEAEVILMQKEEKSTTNTSADCSYIHV
ncbi:hypothetical protein AC249_AIPGENE16297 [Exaiptasia diaphana]|nr:hypothetical protein AC249_AIPGENE16297 [Exaiptasia diaphana]